MREKNNNINWWIIIAVAVIVAIIISVITAGITGNVIRVRDDKLKKYPEVYTKAEVDNLLKRSRANSCDGDINCEIVSATISRDLKVYSLSGHENGYACIDNYGKIFKSLMPCPLCIPKTCDDLGKSCGSFNDECGKLLNCGGCLSGQTCSNGKCITNNQTCTDPIVIKNVGDDKMAVKFKNYKGEEATVQFAKNTPNSLVLAYGDDVKNITVIEKELIKKNGYVMVGNQDEAYLLKVSTITNQSSGYSNDKVVLTDVFNSDNTFTATITSDGIGTITIGGKVYNVKYQSSNSDNDYITLDYPDTISISERVVYPLIQTSRGAKVAFYEPLEISTADVNGLKIPNGYGYSEKEVICNTSFSIGSLEYEITSKPGDIFNCMLYLKFPTGGPITDPALVVIEKESSGEEYPALIVKLEPGYTSSDGIGVDNILETMSTSSYKTLTFSIDDSDADQKTAQICQS